MIGTTAELASLNSFVSSLSDSELSVLLRRSSSPQLSEAESDRQRKKRKRAEARAITLPPVQDPERRLRLEAAGCAEWLRWYRSDLFYHEFTTNQTAIINAIEERIQFGGLKAIAAPRGDGKTAICEGSVQFNLVRGRLRYPVIIAANAEAANDIAGNIKTPFEENERLIADYPEICIPVQELSEAPQLAAGQTVNGRKTNGEWSQKSTRFPTIWLDWCPLCLSPETLGEADGPFLCLKCGHAFELWCSPISGARLRAVGVFGKIRGKRKDAQRPDFALLDDIEDEESAVSAPKKAKIRRVIDKAVAGMAGPDKRMATAFLCTIQNQTCVSAEYTDRKQQAAYSGDRFRQVIKWPESDEAKKHWAKYIELRQDGKRSEEDIDGRAATSHLVLHWAAMHEGAVLANPNRFVKDPGKDGQPLELSALQHIYNVAADRGWDTVLCEYQNAPMDEDVAAGIPKAEAIAKRTTRHDRWVVPPETAKITVGIDVGDYGLWWVVGAWWKHFAGQVLAYGCWPEQGRRFFEKRHLAPTIPEVYRQAHGTEAAGDAMIYWALTELVSYLESQVLLTPDGQRHNIARIGVDSGHEYTAIQRFSQEYKTRGLVLPTKGFGIAVKKLPISQWKETPGTIRGWNSRAAWTQERREFLVEFDANRWKAKGHGLLSLPVGSAGALMLHGGEMVDHRQFSDHLVAERRIEIEANSRKGFEYEPKVGNPDNDWLDALTISAVLAGLEGIKDATDEQKPLPKPDSGARRRQRVSYVD